VGCLGPRAAANKSPSDVLSAYGSGFSKRTGRIDNTFMNNPSFRPGETGRSNRPVQILEPRGAPDRMTDDGVGSGI
jgi:hypothetical protein